MRAQTCLLVTLKGRRGDSVLVLLKFRNPPPLHPAPLPRNTPLMVAMIRHKAYTALSMLEAAGGHRAVVDGVIRPSATNADGKSALMLSVKLQNPALHFTLMGVDLQCVLASLPHLPWACLGC